MRASRLGFAAAAFCLAALQAGAQQDEAPPYDKGPVWTFSIIRTKDGRFDDYMKWLDTDLKPHSEALKREGYILDYKILIINSPRANEGDIWVAREYPNMAVFDHSTKDDYAMFKRVEGSRTDVNTQQASRASMRDFQGEIMAREAILK